jgi:hypothetical protein
MEGEGEKDGQSHGVWSKANSSWFWVPHFKMSPQGLAQVCGGQIGAWVPREQWTVDIADKETNA